MAKKVGMVKPMTRPKPRPATMGAGKTKSMSTKKTNKPKSLGSHIGP